MICFIALPIAYFSGLIGEGLDYLRRQLLPPVPTATPVGNPYVPPFTGGQCQDAQYRVYVRVQPAGENEINTFVTGIGKVQGIIRNQANPFFGINIGFLPASGVVTLASVSNRVNAPAYITQIERLGGGLDNCGDIADPNAPPDIPPDGIADVVPPDFDDNIPLVVAIPPVLIPPFLPDIGDLIDAGKNLIDVADKLDNILDIFDRLTDVVDNIKDKVNDDIKDPEKENRKSVFRYDFGSINKDGFLRLYPDVNTDRLRASYIDLQMLSIPITYGRYFGKLSPNFYRFRSLGYISFVSNTFGRIETKEIEFSRESMTVPDGAFGFFYHLGLDGAVFANVSAFYTKLEGEE